ncbi:hypothetical protein [Methylobacterium sp. JK268]
MVLLASLVVLVALGAGMARVCPFLPMLLASVLVYLGSAIGLVLWGESLLRALGLAVLALVALQVGYVVAGVAREALTGRVTRADRGRTGTLPTGRRGSGEPPPGLR